MVAVLTMDRLRCEDPQDSNIDEIMIQANGRQVWPFSGFFSIGAGLEVPLGVDFAFNGEVTVVLFDQEDIGSDDDLGGVVISEGDTNGSEQFDITGDDFHYVLTYRVKVVD
ncbi:hypothetical protein ACIQK5_31965 [Streptomyces virginiae]|uniref:hypothetical protein n=1 Tax=Streptomyces TaxID=1883 RepID=UPI00136EE9DE|nr:hypothetical protein [Streptomyces sp. SID1046]MYV73853.1 hypothetical protein [Streptomyces sp. SID1046]